MASLHFTPITSYQIRRFIERAEEDHEMDPHSSSGLLTTIQLWESRLRDSEWTRRNFTSCVDLVDVSYAPVHGPAMEDTRADIVFVNGESVFEQLIAYRADGLIPDNLSYFYNKSTKICCVRGPRGLDRTSMYGGIRAGWKPEDDLPMADSFAFCMREGRDDNIRWPVEYLNHNYFVSQALGEMWASDDRYTVDYVNLRNVIEFTDPVKNFYEIPCEAHMATTDIEVNDSWVAIPAYDGPVISQIDEFLENGSRVKTKDGSYGDMDAYYSVSVDSFSFYKFNKRFLALGNIKSDDKVMSKGTRFIDESAFIDSSKVKLFNINDIVSKNEMYDIYNNKEEFSVSILSEVLHRHAVRGKKQCSINGTCGALIFGINSNFTSFFSNRTDRELIKVIGTDTITSPEISFLYNKCFCSIFSSMGNWCSMISIPVKLRRESKSRIDSVTNPLYTTTTNHNPRYVQARICLYIETPLSELSQKHKVFRGLNARTQQAVWDSPGLSMFMSNILNTCKGMKAKIGRVISNSDFHWSKNNPAKMVSIQRSSSTTMGIFIEENDLDNFNLLSMKSINDFGMSRMWDILDKSRFDNKMIRLDVNGIIESSIPYLKDDLQPVANSVVRKNRMIDL